MRKSSKLSLFAATACVLALGLSACGSSSSDASSDASASTSIISAYGCEPQNPLIPTNTNETCGGNPIDLLFAKLVSFDAKGKASNEVAKEIKANSDNTEYTITLKSGWKFTDGTPVTAESFTKAWSYGANATNAQLGSSFFSVIKGYDALQEKGVASDTQLSGLKVVDDDTFTVALNEPNSVFPTMLGYTAYAPLPESFFKDPKAFGEKPVGNGQYKFESWTHNQSIKLVKNDAYKGNQPAKNGGITFKMYTDVEPAYADVQAGNLDVLETVPASQTKTFTTDSTVQAYNKAGSVFQSFTFPSTLEHFKNDEEGHLRRQAISMSIDRKAIVDKVLNGVGTPAVDFTSPMTPGYSDSLKGNSVLKYNKTEAKKLWDEANKISPWNSSDKLTFAYNADGGAKPVYDAIVNSVKNTLGIDAATNPMPTFSEFRAAVTDRSMKSAFRTGWQPDYPSAENYLKPLYSSSAADGNGSNDGDYKNSAFDALISKAASSTSEDDANKDYQAAQELLLKDLPAVPLYYSNANGVAAKGVKGFTMNWKNLPVYQDLTK
ncbi:peptide ABC transporter substrate-binding protein [Bifidobacterium crudilactis]|jgi:oligopeptide transport system substrate-binding protein|uniref:peptide ABC transporter substrate-binding protein n=1 Tax=Bifidobacterium crudilactis TaxID=327277 RepID=UPI00235586A6|nr:ABC transporter substrate-binding protein [Bifidobacterium crudilactis]MCI1217568.1 ABC transporter substrate-binding protein [Bifidobacterium crudilactis]MCI1637119.1 ABC transporter substrate-binding protein [Bifidobacterium crudilactis]